MESNRCAPNGMPRPSSSGWACSPPPAADSRHAGLGSSDRCGTTAARWRGSQRGHRRRHADLLGVRHGFDRSPSADDARGDAHLRRRRSAPPAAMASCPRSARAASRGTDGRRGAVRIGPNNTIVAVDAAVRSGRLLVDGDYIGRALPKMSQAPPPCSACAPGRWRSAIRGELPAARGLPKPNSCRADRKDGLQGDEGRRHGRVLRSRRLRASDGRRRIRARSRDAVPLARTRACGAFIA